ncbi:MAG: hypothetical protein LBM99_04830 [Bacillales bacterium]|jgi:hypothetical protein|nr:hypothetical protein [Bacillales bacterium]
MEIESWDDNKILDYVEEKLKTIDLDVVRKDVIRERVPKYLYIQNNIEKDIDEEFIKNYASYYTMKRRWAQPWRRKKYFEILVELLTGKLKKDFPSINRRMRDTIGSTTTLVYGSKLLATVLPNKYAPLDSFEMDFWNISKPSREEKENEIYDKYCRIVDQLVNSQTAIQLGAWFNEKFPQFTQLPLIKKIDIIIWQFRANV